MPLTLALLAGLALLAPDDDPLARPDTGGPTEVRVGIYVTDVILVDEPSHAFTADVALKLSWRDPRLAGGVVGRRIPLDAAWSPDATLINERQGTAKLPEELVLRDDGGLVSYLQRYTGTFGASFDLREFPLDRQWLHFDLVFLGPSADHVRLVVDPELTGQADALSITDWIVGPGRATVGTYRPTPEYSLPSYTYEVPIERRVGYYLWNVLLPLVLITAMAGTVFWIGPANEGPRYSVAMSSILTLIAYRFLLGGLVPRLSYLTRLDHFILGATVMVFGALVLVVTTSGLTRHGHEVPARRLERWARVVYPAGVVGLLVFAFMA